MYIHPTKYLAYLPNPRTASRATAKALEGIGFLRIGRHHWGFKRGETIDRDLGIPGGRGDLPLWEYRERFLSFTVVRNLRETIESWGRFSGLPPEVWLRDKFDGQRDIIEDWPEWTLFPHARTADRILSYSRLEEDLNNLLKEFDLGPVVLERIE